MTPRPTAPRPMTPRQRRFVEEYLVDLNATQAAKRAGYNPGWGRELGCDDDKDAFEAKLKQIAKTKPTKKGRPKVGS